MLYNPVVSNPRGMQLAKEIARTAHDNKCVDVTVLDLREISQVMDFVVICTGTSDRQIRSVADAVREQGRKMGERPYGFCGYESANWIVADFVDVVLHVFAKSYRLYYDLELLWGDAPRIDWAISESA